MTDPDVEGAAERMYEEWRRNRGAWHEALENISVAIDEFGIVTWYALPEYVREIVRRIVRGETSGTGR